MPTKFKINILFTTKALDKMQKLGYNELSQKNIEVNNSIQSRKEFKNGSKNSCY